MNKKDRIFHHRISWASYAGMVVLAVCALSFLWHRERPASIVVGLLLAMVTVMVVERMLHTRYVFRGNQLHISPGRFARAQEVCVAHVSKVSVVSMPLGLRRYVLLQMDDGRELAVQPESEQAFMEEMEKRKNE